MTAFAAFSSNSGNHSVEVLRRNNAVAVRSQDILPFPRPASKPVPENIGMNYPWIRYNRCAQSKCITGETLRRRGGPGHCAAAGSGSGGGRGRGGAAAADAGTRRSRGGL